MYHRKNIYTCICIHIYVDIYMNIYPLQPLTTFGYPVTKVFPLRLSTKAAPTINHKNSVMKPQNYHHAQHKIVLRGMEYLTLTNVLNIPLHNVHKSAHFSFKIPLTQISSFLLKNALRFFLKMLILQENYFSDSVLKFLITLQDNVEEGIPLPKTHPRFSALQSFTSKDKSALRSQEADVKIKDYKNCVMEKKHQACLLWVPIVCKKYYKIYLLISQKTYLFLKKKK